MIDLILGLWLSAAAYQGFKRGLVMEGCSIMAFLGAMLASGKILETTLPLAQQWFPQASKALPYIAFIAIFLGILLAGAFVGRIFRRAVRLTFLGQFDYVLGAVVGVCKSCLFVSALIWLGDRVHLSLPEYYTEKSVLFPWIKEFLPRCMEGLGPLSSFYKKTRWT